MLNHTSWITLDLELTNRCRALHFFDFINIKSIINLLSGTDKSAFERKLCTQKREGILLNKVTTEKQTMKKKKSK